MIEAIKQIREMLLKIGDKNPLYLEMVSQLDTCLITLRELEERHEPIAPQITALLHSATWKKTKLLESAYQQLQKHYEVLDISEKEHVKTPDIQAIRQAARTTKHAGMHLVFVSLYQADGLNMKKWASLLGSIGDLAASRPVYQQESDVRNMIQTKEQKQNEGYVAIYITPGKTKLLQTEDIAYFEHVSGQYNFQDGILIKQ
ncbi:MAG: type IVB secretion system protein IcmQ [Gammaproteobacteria bacterium]